MVVTHSEGMQRELLLLYRIIPVTVSICARVLLDRSIWWQCTDDYYKYSY